MGNDRITGGEGNDVLSGQNGHDFLMGRDGDDQLFSSNGDTRLIGGLGNDEIDMIDGNSTATGNMGADRFIVQFTEIGQGDQVITDCLQGQDELVIFWDFYDGNIRGQAKLDTSTEGWSKLAGGSLKFDLNQFEGGLHGTVTLLGVTDFAPLPA